MPTTIGRVAGTMGNSGAYSEETARAYRMNFDCGAFAGITKVLDVIAAFVSLLARIHWPPRV